MKKVKKLKKSIGKKRETIMELLFEMNKIVEVPSYIESDPVQFLHWYSDKQDRLIAGFFAAIMAWGRRDIAIAKVSDLLERMGNKPSHFIGNYPDMDTSVFQDFKHRTFKPDDIHVLCECFFRILQKYGDIEAFWAHVYLIAQQQKRPLLGVFHEQFFEIYPEALSRSKKHVANPEKGSSAKRLWLYLRWTVRQNSVVDLGIMNFMSPADLQLPLDVHVARWARAFGLLTRPQNDVHAVAELTNTIKKYHPSDPAVFDYGLFGIGVLKKDISPELLVNAWALENG